MHASRPVLAIGDLSPSATNAAWRAALVARDHRAPLRLLHAQPDGGGLAAAHFALGRLASEIRDLLGLEVAVQVTQGDTLREAVAAARDARLLVIGSRRGNPLREWILGTQAERLIRLARVPVLVVKRTAGAAYRRVLVAVDLHPDAGAVVASASAFSRGPRLEVLHALETREELTMRARDVPERVRVGLRQRAAREAHTVLEHLIAHAGVDRRGAMPSVGYGQPGGVVLARERALRAELVVIGKRRRGLLADFFLGSVTQQVLAASRADVLVLAPAPEARASDFRDQLDFHARARGDLRHAEGAARMRPLGPEHFA